MTLTADRETTQSTATQSAVFVAPGRPGSVVEVKPRYENFIGGKWVPPVKGRYMANVSPVNGKPFCEVARSTAEDVELALDAAHAAKDAWGETSLTERAAVLNAIADAIEANLEMLAVAETWENGKPVRETLAADIPLGGRPLPVLRRSDPIARGSFDRDRQGHGRLPLPRAARRGRADHPVQLPAADGGLEDRTGARGRQLHRGQAGVADAVVDPQAGRGDRRRGPPRSDQHRHRARAGRSARRWPSSPRIAKIGFTGETTTGRLIMQYAAQNLIPSTVELGGKSPNIFFADVMDEDDEFLDKAIEGLVLYAFNKGEVCTCPSRALIHESIYDRFMERCLDRIAKIRQGDPLDPATMIGPQVSTQQMEKIASYVDIGRQEGAECLIGGNRSHLGGELEDGYYFEPTVLKGHNGMRVFQEEIFGPVLAVTTFTDEADAIRIANDTLYGLGAGVWTRNGNVAYRMGRAIKAGRVWTNCYHLYPAGAAFGGYKISGVGRENHQMMLEHYSQTKNLLVSYSTKPLGFF